MYIYVNAMPCVYQILGIQPKARFYCVNILEEIDTPSEVCVHLECVL